MEIILNSQGEFQNVNCMQYYNSFEQGMITNPVIQGVSVGGHNRPNMGVTSGDVYFDPEAGNTYHSYDVIFKDKPDDKLNQFDKNARHEASLNYNCGL